MAPAPSNPARSRGALARLLALGTHLDMPWHERQRMTVANGTALACVLNGAGAAAVAAALGAEALAATLALVPLAGLVSLVLAFAGATLAARACLPVGLTLGSLAVAFTGGPELVSALPFLTVTYPIFVFSSAHQLVMGGCVALSLAGASLMYLPGALPPPTTALAPGAAGLLEVVFASGTVLTLLAMSLINQGSLHSALTRIDDQRQRATEADAAKSRFLATVSHELRTPLAAIRGAADLLEEGEDEAFLREALGRNARYLLDLIDRILDLSKIEAGQLVVERTSTSVRRAVQNAVTLVRPLAEEKGLDLELVFLTPIPRRIHSAPVRLRQVLLNLLSNAVKYTREGKVTVSVTLLRRPEEAVVEVSVQDTGPGIPEHALDKVFEPFYQLEAPLQAASTGTGLGLPICRDLTQLIGGTLRVHSKPDEGSTFVVSLPVNEDELEDLVRVREDPDEDAERRGSTRAPPGLDGLRILIAEDSEDLARLLTLHLERLGATVRHAADGQEAVEVAASEAFDIILMDWQMPRMTGEEATRTLRRRGFREPILALTAHALEGHRERAAAAGFDAYLAKPVETGRLAGEILRLTRGESALDLSGPSSAPSLPSAPPIVREARSIDRPVLDAAPEASMAPRPAGPGPAPTDEAASRRLQLDELRRSYAARLPGRTDEILTLARGEDRERVGHHLHKLAGTASMYGYPEIGTLARELKEALDQGASLQDLDPRLVELRDAGQHA